MKLSARATTAGFGLAALLLVPGIQAQNENEASADTIVTALPKSGEAVLPIPQSAVKVEVDGKTVQPLVWRPYGQGDVQLAILIDNGLRSSFGRNLEDLSKFVQDLPPNVAVGVAYMQNGTASFSAPFNKNHAVAAQALRLPLGTPGVNASPYFCLQDLAKRWPAARSAARREVLMITDGVDPYNPRFDPQNPYISAALDAVSRANLVIFPIYYRDQGRFSGTLGGTDSGQNYLTQVADATGGNFYYQGLSNPVSFTPFLADLSRRLENQYELGVPVKEEKNAGFANLKVKSDIGGVKLRAADRIAVAAAGSGEQ